MLTINDYLRQPLEMLKLTGISEALDLGGGRPCVISSIMSVGGAVCIVYDAPTKTGTEITITSANVGWPVQFSIPRPGIMLSNGMSAEVISGSGSLYVFYWVA